MPIIRSIFTLTSLSQLNRDSLLTLRYTRPPVRATSTRTFRSAQAAVRDCPAPRSCPVRHDDAVSQSGGGKTMGNKDNCLIFRCRKHGMIQLIFRDRIKGAGGFVSPLPIKNGRFMMRILPLVETSKNLFHNTSNLSILSNATIFPTLPYCAVTASA